MKDKYKFYASNTSNGHGNFLEPLGFDSTKNIEEADVVIFGGGADIDPETYGEKPGSRTHISSDQEKREKKDFQFALQNKIKCFGICRGHQLLCSLSGGKLIQHTTGHAGSEHTMDTIDGLRIRTNSLHHQMINPYMMNPKNYKILAWTSKRISRKYLGAGDKSITLPYEFKEIEAIYFPSTNSMGVQYHPEMMYGSKETETAVDWTQKMFMKFFNNQF